MWDVVASNFVEPNFVLNFAESNFAESNFAESNFGRGGAAGWRIVVGKIVGLIVGSVGNDGIGFAGAAVGLTCV